jgi:hypothetical protein
MAWGGQVHRDALPQKERAPLEVETCAFESRCDGFAFELDRDVPHVIRRLPEHAAHASLFPTAGLGMIDFEDSKMRALRVKAIRS